jgi:chemotaxis receptor (MCP) glutamine deamidase CheD
MDPIRRRRPLWVAVLLLAALSARADAPIPDVRMDEYLVARAADHPVVRTFGVSTCVVLTLYDPADRIGALAHVSAEADVPRSLDAVFADLRAAGAKPAELRAQLFGGWRTEANGPFRFHSTSPEMVAAIKAALARRGIAVAREETLSDPAHPGGVKPIRSFSFDLRTGAVEDIEPGPGVVATAGDDPAENARFARTHLLQRSPDSREAGSPAR